MLTLNQRGTAIDNLAKAARIMGVGLDRQGLEGLWQPFVGMHHQLVVVRTRHANVHIIVPGNKALVANGAQHGACPAIVGEMMFATDLVN